MAISDAAAVLTANHRLLQLRLAAETATQIRQLWRILDLSDIDATAPTWSDAVVALVTRRNSSSQVLAQRYFTQFRGLELGDPGSTVKFPAVGVSGQAVKTSVMVTGPFRFRHGMETGQAFEVASSNAFRASSAAAIRHVLNGGRDMLVGAVQSDPRAIGWARVTSARPCAFCAMLASRGPVFKSRESAVAGSFFSTAVNDFRAHDSCACTAEPVYSTGSEWPGRSREWAALYDREAKGHDDPRNAFRRAYEAQSGVEQ